jgi:hypothetical protein
MYVLNKPPTTKCATRDNPKPPRNPNGVLMVHNPANILMLSVTMMGSHKFFMQVVIHLHAIIQKW